ncbi:MAG: hypothetical protein JWM49_630 [Microbacteriaceae bacterium]|nr:hypothetical protein [Microbacteriaceae bacterium]
MMTAGLMGAPSSSGDPQVVDISDGRCHVLSTDGTAEFKSSVAIPLDVAKPRNGLPYGLLQACVMAGTLPSDVFSIELQITEPTANVATTTRWVRITYDPAGVPIPQTRVLAPTPSSDNVALPASAPPRNSDAQSSTPASGSGSAAPQSASTNASQSPAPISTPLLVVDFAALLAVLGSGLLSLLIWLGRRNSQSPAAPAHANPSESTNA